VELCLRDRTWGPCTALARAERSGEDFGPIRQIFARGVCGIFGSEAQEENALRFLANMLLMTGHSSLPVFRDDEVLQQDGQLAPPTICEGLIVVGTPETNRALVVLLQDNHGVDRWSVLTPLDDRSHVRTMARQASLSPARARAHKFMVIMSLTTVFLFSGTVFGWGAFSEMLQAALNNAFTLVNWRSYWGWLVDSLGPTKVTIIAGILASVGLMGIALTKAGSWSKQEAEGGHFDIFLWSTVLTAVGGSMTMFIGYQAPFIVPSSFTLLIEVNSCLFDAGTIIFPLLKVLYDLGVPFSAFFWAYTVLGFICYSLFSISWGMNQKELDEIRAAAGGDEHEGPEHNRPLEQRSFMSQLRSFEFVSIFIYSIIMVPRANMYMGTFSMINRKIAEGEGTMSSLNFVNTITGFVIPFGFVAVPLIELCMHRLGTLWTVQLTTLIGVVYNLLQLVPSLHLQLVSVVIFAAWRAFLYSTISAFNGEIFGVKTMGRIMGLCFVFSGLTNMATGPLVNAAVDSGDFTRLLIEDLVITIPLPILFYVLQ
ncbi:FMP42, partial [Symbiodinium sp. KB8]